jgi:hypothetical protein
VTLLCLLFCTKRSLVPISYYSHLMTSAEMNYSTCATQCLAVIFGFEKCSMYLEHGEFELHCGNLSLCWLLKWAKDVGRLEGGYWVQPPLKF